MSYAPIAVFAFNRPEHLKKTIRSLIANPESAKSILYCFCDGPRIGFQDEEKIDAIVKWISTIEHSFERVELIKRPINFGLARSIIEGVTHVVEHHGEVIVLEDDMYLSPFFLKYMNDGLRYYEFEHRVCSLHGYSYPVEGPLPESFFLRGADCWGWATWKRGWKLFDADGKKLFNEIEAKGLTKQFNYNDTYSYTGMLKDQIEGKNNSWAIRWYASTFLADKLTLYPGKSLVHNFGLDSSGTHCETTDVYSVSVAQSPISVSAPIEHDSYAYEQFSRFFSGHKVKVSQGRFRACIQKLRNLWFL